MEDVCPETPSDNAVTATNLKDDRLKINEVCVPRRRIQPQVPHHWQQNDWEDEKALQKIGLFECRTFIFREQNMAFEDERQEEHASHRITLCTLVGGITCMSLRASTHVFNSRARRRESRHACKPKRGVADGRVGLREQLQSMRHRHEENPKSQPKEFRLQPRCVYFSNEKSGTHKTHD